MSLDNSLVERILELFHSGENVTSKLIEMKLDITYEVIELLYDLQAGTYTKNAAEKPKFIGDFTLELYSKIRDYLCNAESILDAGVGEANILIPLVEYFPNLKQVFGIDASWSRLSWASNNCKRLKNTSVNFAVSEMRRIPMADNSVDVSITIHALEPNGGGEFEILQESFKLKCIESTPYSFFEHSDNIRNNPGRTSQAA
jgi:SAM-dependent methyltransferase